MLRVRDAGKLEKMITSQNILLRVQLVVSVSYIIVKFLIRPTVIDNEYTGLVKIFVLSYPNFCEAVVGTIFVAFLLLLINSKIVQGDFVLQEKYIPFISVLISGIYVLLQEFKVHNIGGNNVYDPYDVLFSILGLLVTLLFLNIIKPRVITN
jgi:hypothetical protein